MTEKQESKLVGKEEGIDSPPDLELLEQLLKIHYLPRDLWLACIRFLSGRVSLRKLLMRDQGTFFSWPLLPRTPGKYERNSNFLAIDCGMIQTKNSNHFPARFSLVNYYGRQLLSLYIVPDSTVVKWRTSQSGMTCEIYEKARKAGNVVQLWEVAGLIDELTEKYHAILVGHNIISLLKALGMGALSEDKYLDTQTLGRFKDECGGNEVKLLLAVYYNGPLQFQCSAHYPLEHARASMLLFRTFQREFHEAYELEYHQ